MGVSRGCTMSAMNSPTLQEKSAAAIKSPLNSVPPACETTCKACLQCCMKASRKAGGRDSKLARRAARKTKKTPQRIASFKKNSSSIVEAG